MRISTTKYSSRTIARFAGLLYLIFIVTYTFATLLQSKRIVRGDIATTINNIISSEQSFILGLITQIFSLVTFFVTAYTLFYLLKRVNKRLALLFLILNLIGVLIECTSTVFRFQIITALNNANNSYLVTTNQLQSHITSLLNLNKTGDIIAMLFYGLWLFPLGYLVFKSGFFPKLLAILLIMDGFAVVIFFFKSFFFPNIKAINYPLFLVMFIAEMSFSLWLLIKGVKKLEVA